MKPNVDLRDNVWEKATLMLPHLPLIRLISGLKGVKSIVEFGAGTGADILKLAELGYEATYTDYSDIAIHKIEKLLLDKKIQNMNILKCDVTDISFPKHSFDLIYSCGLIEHFDADIRTEIIRNMIKISDKYVIIDFPNRLSLHNVIKKILMLFGKWPYGEETEFSYWEFKEYINKNFAKDVDIINFYGRELRPIPRIIKQKYGINLFNFKFLDKSKGSLGFLLKIKE